MTMKLVSYLVLHSELTSHVVWDWEDAVALYRTGLLDDLQENWHD
jgi:hypothetical protein